MMTSRKSNCLNYIKRELRKCQDIHPGVIMNAGDVDRHVDALFDGFGIRLLNTLDSESLGAFLFFNGSFYVLRDVKGFSQSIKVEESVAFELLSLFYQNRALASVPRLYGDDIVEITQQLNDKIFNLFA